MNACRVQRVGAFGLTWGESLRWDDERQRLYFVDCARSTLHWLETAEPPLHTFPLPSLPTEPVLIRGPELVVCLADGIWVVDPDSKRSERLATYSAGMHGRANDANADAAGNLVTGTLNLAPGPRSLWRFSSSDGWSQIDDGIGNANGPVALTLDGEPSLIIGDTLASMIYAYPYEPNSGIVGARRIYANYRDMGGAPDGASADAAGGVWSCVLRAGKLARLLPSGVDRLIDLPVPNPSDVAFGGAGRDRLYLTSIAVDLGDGPPPEEAGWLMVLDGLGVEGMPEQRFGL